MGNRLIDITGKKFGRTTVVCLGESYIKKNGTKGTPFWNCVCDCGKEHTARGHDLRHGKVSSCGCKAIESRTKHGMYTTRVYKIWHDMKSRCANKNDTSYDYYGGRGIGFCDSWNDFENFYKDMGDCPTPSHTIDRIDVDGNYEKNNCRWATRSEQMKNRRPYKNWNQKISAEDVVFIRSSDLSTKELAEKFNVGYKHICAIKSKTARKQT